MVWLEKYLKFKVKNAVKFVSEFEKLVGNYARQHKVDGIICGHIHQAADKMMNNVHYLNSGDWVETMSALVETEDGNWSILYYNDWLQQQSPVETIETGTSYFPSLTPELL